MFVLVSSVAAGENYVHTRWLTKLEIHLTIRQQNNCKRCACAIISPLLCFQSALTL